MRQCEANTDYPWVISALLSDAKVQDLRRFLNRQDAEDCLRNLKRAYPQREFCLTFEDGKMRQVPDKEPIVASNPNCTRETVMFFFKEDFSPAMKNHLAGLFFSTKPSDRILSGFQYLTLYMLLDALRLAEPDGSPLEEGTNDVFSAAKKTILSYLIKEFRFLDIPEILRANKIGDEQFVIGKPESSSSPLIIIPVGI